MGRFVEGDDRRQSFLLPDSLDDYLAEDNPVRVVEVFIEELDLGALGFEGVQPAATGRPAYHPSTLLKNLPLRLPQPRPVQPPSRA
jgi:transposase